MEYTYQNIIDAAATLRQRFAELEAKSTILKQPELTSLMSSIKDLPASDRQSYGAQVNGLKAELQALLSNWQAEQDATPKEPIDVTAPFAAGHQARPSLLGALTGSVHPISTAEEEILDIFYRMGFTAVESRLIDDQYHMFDSLNFPANHPARDQYDNFYIDALDDKGQQLLAPAHTSTMQHRVISKHKDNLELGLPIAAIVPGRVFRNEDVDARHEHTFNQVEGIFVGEGVTVGNLLATLKAFMAEYYQDDVEIKTQPFYFPFTEPSFELAISCPFCKKSGCKVCGEGWIELLGCGMIHPEVLRQAGVDPTKYTGFAFGAGFMRIAMIKYDIEDVRHFQSGKLSFLRQFA